MAGHDAYTTWTAVYHSHCNDCDWNGGEWWDDEPRARQEAAAHRAEHESDEEN